MALRVARHGPCRMVSTADSDGVFDLHLTFASFDSHRLSQLRFTTARLDDTLDLAKVRHGTGVEADFVIAELVQVVDKTEVNDKVLDAWLAKAQSGLLPQPRVVNETS